MYPGESRSALLLAGFLRVFTGPTLRFFPSLNPREQLCPSVRGFSRRRAPCVFSRTAEEEKSQAVFSARCRHHDKHQGVGLRRRAGRRRRRRSDPRRKDGNYPGNGGEPVPALPPTLGFISPSPRFVSRWQRAFIRGTQCESALTTRERWVDSGGREMRSPVYKQRHDCEGGERNVDAYLLQCW